jgi:hypothetical protein
MDARGLVGVDLVQPFGQILVPVFRQVFRHGPGVELASGHTKTLGQRVSGPEELVGEGYRGFHTPIIPCSYPPIKRSSGPADAIAAGVQILVTGDKDLLDIAEESPIPILSPRAFLMITRRDAL